MDEIPTLEEVELLPKRISRQYRLLIYLQSGGLRIGETPGLRERVSAAGLHPRPLAGQLEGEPR